MKRKSRLAARIQAARKEAGMTPAAVAEAMKGRGHDGWTEHSVVGAENDRRELSGYELNALAQVLGSSRDELLPPDTLVPTIPGLLGFDLEVSETHLRAA